LITVIERFDPERQDGDQFSCGKPTLDDYIRGVAAQDERTYAAAVFVMVDSRQTSERRRIIGYYTLNAFAFQRDQARRRDRDKALPGYRTVPALLIGWFALDTGFQGRGLGSTLLIAALARSLRLSGEVGVAVVVVHALDNEAARFYTHQGFTPFKDEPNHLYYPIATIAAALDSGA
jgi:GNAT superfamily N-acetyltransferase